MCWALKGVPDSAVWEDTMAFIGVEQLLTAASGRGEVDGGGVGGVDGGEIEGNMV